MDESYKMPRPPPFFANLSQRKLHLNTKNHNLNTIEFNVHIYDDLLPLSTLNTLTILEPGVKVSLN